MEAKIHALITHCICLWRSGMFMYIWDARDHFYSSKSIRLEVLIFNNNDQYICVYILISEWMVTFSSVEPWNKNEK